MTLPSARQPSAFAGTTITEVPGSQPAFGRLRHASDPPIAKGASMVTTLTYAQLDEAVHDAYEACKDLQGGKNADYIPYLANVDSDLFGISLCLPDGRVVSVGDTGYRLGIESVSKVHTAILVLRQIGAQQLLEKIGADATGLPFNSIFAILLENDHPSTPLVNSGAITACSLVAPQGNADAKWQAIVDNMTDL